MDIVTLFCDIGDFCSVFEPAWRRRLLASGAVRRHKPGPLALSELMTTLVLFHASRYRDFKTFYTRHVARHLAGDFPRLVSYGRFVESRREALMPLRCYLRTRFGDCTGIAFADATTLAACHHPRIPQHKVFADCARRGQSSMVRFYGLKLHPAINDRGELPGCYLTPGDVGGRRPVPHPARSLRGKLSGDKGCISRPLGTPLSAQGLRLVTKLKKNMKDRFLPPCDKLPSRKRALVETVDGQLQNISRVGHTRHRSLWNFPDNVAAGLAAYPRREKKPSLNIELEEQFLTSN